MDRSGMLMIGGGVLMCVVIGALVSPPVGVWTLGGFILGFACFLVVEARRRAQRLESVSSRLWAMRDVPISRRLGAPGEESVRAGVIEGDLHDAQLDRAIAELDDHITRQVKELAKKTRNLESLIDAIPEPVLVTGAKKAVLLSNHAAEEVFAGGAGPIVGRLVTELFTREELVRLHDAAHAGTQQRTQVTITTPIGPRTYEVTATPLPAAWGEGVFGALLVFKNVTDLAQSVQAQRDFVANASHELRTPVAALKIAVETLKDNPDDAPLRDKLLTVCESHVQRLEDTIRDLLDLSRHESGAVEVRVEPLDLRAMEASLTQAFESIAAQRQLRLRFDFDPRVNGRLADPNLISLICRNLIDNATKFAHPQTVIDISAKPADEAAWSATEMSAVRLAVQDRGVGIPLAQQERVFDRFYQVDQARTGMTGRRGAGLGLAIVKRAAQAMHGSVGVHSVWGQGTTVWVEVPMKPSGQTH